MDDSGKESEPVYDESGYDDKGVVPVADDGLGRSGDTSSSGHSSRSRLRSPGPRRRFPSMAERRQGGLRQSHPGFRDKERDLHKPSAGKVGDKESSLADKAGGLFNDVAGASVNANPLVRFAALLARNKRRSAVGGVVSAAVVIFMIFAGIAHGPLEFIHFAQLLQQFHLRSNEDFGDKRSMKVLLYALIGQGAENGRLGVVGNAAANVWEGRLVEQTGMRPVFSERNGRFVGFAIENDTRAQSILGDIGEDTKTSNKLEASMGKGAEIQTVKEAKQGGDNFSVHGERLPDDTRIINLSKVGFKDRRVWIRTLGKSTGTFRIASSVGSRLLITRGGVRFHPLENIGYRKWLDKRADKKAQSSREDYDKELREKRAKFEAEGVKGVSGVKAGESKDKDGNPEVKPSDVDASEDATKLIDQFKSTGAVKIAGAGAAVVGVLCAAKSFGDHVDDYKYANNGLPMMRMGWDVISQGNQVMAGNVNFDELGAFSKSFYDSESGTSWANAKTIRANLGQDYKNSPDLPPEAQLKNVGDKPAFFDALDSIGPLGTTCGAVDTFLGLPVISDVLSVLGDIQNAALNAALSIGGTSVEELVNKALAVVAGKSVNPDAKGAEYGNLADTGAFMAGNSQAASMGGVPLSNAQLADLKAEENYVDQQENKNKSLADRYLNPRESSSLMASLMMESPRSLSQAASILSLPISGLKSISAKFGSVVAPKTSAATPEGIYGLPKFGFSEDEQSDSRFENPYDNAKVMEAHDGKLLKRANDKWGKCFGMRVTIAGGRVHIKTEDKSSDEVNPFKVVKDKDCQHKSASPKISEQNDDSLWSKLAFWQPKQAQAATPAARVSADDLLFLRYRFYVADSVMAVSLACFEGNEGYCAEAGFKKGTGGAVSPTTIADATVDMAHIYDSSEDISCAPGTSDLGIQDGYHDGNKVKIRICAVSNFPSSGEESHDAYGVKGASGKAVVNSRVSGAIYALVAAAKQDGVNFSAGSAFRTMAHQQALWDANPNPDEVAPPGTSNHQMGLAIDFSGIGKTEHSGPYWDWLSSNAKDFGYKNYPNEAWHWSPTGN